MVLHILYTHIVCMLYLMEYVHVMLNRISGDIIYRDGHMSFPSVN